MELARVSKTGISLASEVELLSWTCPAGNPREVIARATLGGQSNHLSGAGGTYSLRFYINGSQVVPLSDIAVPSGMTVCLTVSRPVPVDVGDLVSVRIVGQAGDTVVDTTTTLRNATPVMASDLGGDGSVIVNHNYGGPDALAYQTPQGVGIVDATVRAYQQADYLANRTGASYIVAQTTTDSSGRWVKALMLDPGTYVIVFFRRNLFGPDAMTVTVS